MSGSDTHADRIRAALVKAVGKFEPDPDMAWAILNEWDRLVARAENLHDNLARVQKHLKYAVAERHRERARADRAEAELGQALRKIEARHVGEHLTQFETFRVDPIFPGHEDMGPATAERLRVEFSRGMKEAYEDCRSIAQAARVALSAGSGGREPTPEVGVLGLCAHGVDLDREFCPQGCRV